MKRVAIDIDGVTAEFAHAANNWLAGLLGTTTQPIDRWDWYRNYGPDGETAWAEFWKMTSKHPEWFVGLPSVEGAVDSIRKLHRRRDELSISFVTARNPRYEEATRLWLKQRGLGDVALIMTQDKAGLGCDIYIDDHVDQVQAAAATGAQALLFVRPWNAAQAENFEYVTGWSDATAAVLGLRR